LPSGLLDDDRDAVETLAVRQHRHDNRPKGSTTAQLLEAKDHLQQMLVAIPLTEEERAVVEEGAQALDRLLARLADVPTPTGQMPHQLA
jgi:hypothetical protein